MAVFSAISSALIGVGLNIFGATAAGWAAATIFSNVVLGAALFGVGLLANSAFNQAPSIRTPQAQAVINQSAGPRIRGYGKALLGGTRAFFDSKDGDLSQYIMMHSGEIDAIEQFFVGDIAANLTEDGYATNAALRSGGDWRVRILSRLGTTGQSAITPSAWPIWTNDHRLRGIAYIYARFRSPGAEDYQKVFPEGHNTPVRARCRLSKVYDPRAGGQSATNSSTWTWSDNASLVILDFLTHPDGMRLSKDDCDLDSFAAFADLCDQNVALAAGGTEKRYRLWGVYSLADEPQPILNQMRRACDAELYHTPEGKVAIRGGKWEPPTVTIDAKDILGHSMEQGNSRFSEFNELKIMYTSPEHDYQTMEATSWIDLADQEARGPIPSSLDLDFVPSPSQARRLAKIHVSKSNPRWKGRVRCNASGLRALGERTVQIIIPELEINEAFFISKIMPSPDLSSVELEVMTISEAAYTWSTAEEGENPAIPQETSPDLDFPVPENLTLSLDSATRIEADVDEPGRDDLALEVQIRLGAGGLWQSMSVTSETQAFYDFTDDGTYQARARWVGPSSTVGDWSSPLAEITIPVPEPEPDPE